MSISRPTGVILSALALTLALGGAVGGGVGYAAGKLPKNSVTSVQVKNNALKGADVKDGALTGADLAANSLTGSQIDESTLSLPAPPAQSGRVLLISADFAQMAAADLYSWDGSSVYANSVGNFGLQAAVPLPDGAVVTAIKVFLLDNGGSAVSATVGVVTPSTGGYTTPTTTSSSGAIAGARTMDLVPVSPAAGQALVLNVDLEQGASMYRLYGAEVVYH